MEKCYIAIDLKSFYASVECMDRGLDPMDANLLVADPSRTEKTICLAVSPALKSYGIPGRARLFEANEKLRDANARRLALAKLGSFEGSSCSAAELKADPALEIDYIMAPPRMARYMEVSTRIYDIYLRHVAPEDMHVYSIDEVFIDATMYLRTTGLSPRDFAMRIIREVLSETGITATAGIGSNMYLCKIAMDVMAKRCTPDAYGVRIAELTEQSYRRSLWDHRPLTDFWRVGRGIAKKLEAHGIFTMGDIARCSLGSEDSFYNEGLLYKLFGVNAELLIDHAWGWESCNISDIKAYRPASNSISTGQVLKTPYSFEMTRVIVREMTDLLVLDLVEKGLVTDQLTLTLGYDIENLSDPERRAAYKGEVTTDLYGRRVPKHAHGTATLKSHSSSTRLITEAVLELFDRVTDPELLVRRVTIAACRVLPEGEAPEPAAEEQMDFFTDYSREEQEKAALERERRRQKAVIGIRSKHGKNAILRGTNFEKGATTIERNGQIGGHKA